MFACGEVQRCVKSTNRIQVFWRDLLSDFDSRARAHMQQDITWKTYIML